MITITNKTEISAQDMADAFAGASSREQKVFLESLVDSIEATMGFGKWAMQCRAVVDEPSWDADQRFKLVSFLEVLIEHLKEKDGAAS